jgi:rhamnulokinase
LPATVEPGERVGPTLPELEIGLATTPRLEVVTVGSHDTASAVVAVPMEPTSAAYISCGTWGIVGIETEAPILTSEARAANFTNEGGVDGRIRFLHNVVGLWLLSETIRTWEATGEPIELTALLTEAADVTVPVAVFDPNDDRLLAPGDMPARIDAICRELGEPVPRTRAEMVQSILSSLANAFAQGVHTAATLGGIEVRTIHIVGGGALNTLLCQLTADFSGLEVKAGPVEATAIGNVLVQARAAAAVSGDIDALRATVARSVEITTYRPRPSRSIR